MRPRFEPASPMTHELLKAAKELEMRIAKKEGSMPDYSNQEEGATTGHARFEIQPAGIPNAFYNTNNAVPQVEDVANKGAISENSNILTEASPYYPTAFSTDIEVFSKSHLLIVSVSPMLVLTSLCRL